MIDSHVHLYPPEFSTEETPSLLTSAHTKGLRGAVIVSETLNDARFLVETYDACHPTEIGGVKLFACAGLHPAQPTGGFDTQGRPVYRTPSSEEMEQLEQLILFNMDRLVGIGETGLDFRPIVLGRDEPTSSQTRDLQISLLLRHLRLSLDLGLPLNLHSRSAGRHVIDLLRAHHPHWGTFDHPDATGMGILLHAFDGKIGYALDAARSGVYFSIVPAVVREESKLLKRLATECPLKQLCLETDAPACGFPGMKNVPENIGVSACEIARLRNMDLDDVVRATTDNAFRLFPRVAQAFNELSAS